MPTDERSMDRNLLLEQRISVERLARYRTFASGDLARAIEFYERGSKLSGELWVVLGHLEVLVRNAMHQQLVAWTTRQFGEPLWYTDPGMIFNDKTTTDIAIARTRAVLDGNRESPGKVVAELNFGFWRFLVAIRYERSLWRTCLHRAFPGQGRRKAVHAKLAALHELRNRIAHHEPIHNRPLHRLYDDALTLTGWVCPITQDWIRQQHLVPSLELVPSLGALDSARIGG